MFHRIMMGNDDIFDEFNENKKVDGQEEKKKILITNIKEKYKVTPHDDFGTDKKTVSKQSKRKLGLIGMIIIGLIVGGSVYGFQVGIIGNSVPNELTEKIKETVDKMNPIEFGKSMEGDGDTMDVSSATDRVEVGKTNEIIGYYLITSDDNWYGDFVDFRKIPNKIEYSGNMKVNFRCFTDDFAKTSTYFANFRNEIKNDLKVDVYINEKLVESESTNVNKAIILEGNCLK